MSPDLRITQLAKPPPSPLSERILRTDRRSAEVQLPPALVLMALMHLSFTNDTADAVLGKGIELSPLAVGAMYAAGTAWDRYVRRPEDGDEEGG